MPFATFFPIVTLLSAHFPTLPFFPLIKQYATDERNFVKKAVSWALRQIGKRNSHLRVLAAEWADALKQTNSKTAQWIAKDVLRELQKKETV
jgi:3-methyladenine DNA glycosylase AlkD